MLKRYTVLLVLIMAGLYYILTAVNVSAAVASQVLARAVVQKVPRTDNAGVFDGLKRQVHEVNQKMKETAARFKVEVIRVNETQPAAPSPVEATQPPPAAPPSLPASPPPVAPPVLVPPIEVRPEPAVEEEPAVTVSIPALELDPTLVILVHVSKWEKFAAVQETWAAAARQRGAAIIYFSSKISGEGIHNNPMLGTAIEKTIDALEFAYASYPGSLWFFKCDEDTWVDVTNLYALITDSRNSFGTARPNEWPNLTAGFNASEETFYGGFPQLMVERIPAEHLYASGGAGYLLSGGTMAKYGNKLRACQRYHDFEDAFIGHCLKSLHVPFTDIPGFHPHDVYQMIRWAHNPTPYHARPEPIQQMTIPPVTWHYITPDTMRAMNVPTAQRKIPKIIHQMWFGDQSRRPKQWMDTCRDMHPESEGWEYRLYNESHFENIVHKSHFDGAVFNLKSDIARYEILYRYGGFYIDADSECLKSFEPLINQTTTEVVAAFENEKERPGLVATGVLGSVPQSETMRTLMTNLLTADWWEPAWKSAGPLYFTQQIAKFHAETSVTLLPSQTFYPIHHTHAKQTSTQAAHEKAMQDGAYTLQFWGTTHKNYMRKM